MKDSSGNSLSLSEPPQQQSSNSLLYTDTEYTYEDESNSDLRKKRRLLGVLSSRGRLAFRRSVFSSFRKLNLVSNWLTDSAYHDFFLGEENLDESLTQMGWLKDKDVTVIPDFSHEGGKEENDIVSAYRETYRSFEFASEHRNLIPFVLLKTKLLVDDATFIKYATQPKALSEEEREEVERFHNRFISLCRLAYDLDLSVVIDADHYLCQPIVDKYTDEVMMLFNKHKPVVFATLDCYREDRVERLKEIRDFAEKHDLYAGVALSEGLYREEEKAFALKNGYPLLPNVKPNRGDALFRESCQYVFQHLDRLSLLAITHQPSHCLYLLDLMTQNEIEEEGSKVSFAQIMGVADGLTFALSRRGCNVSKILPYGKPIESLYLLFERFYSNKTCRQLALLEKKSIRKEIARRRREC